MALQHTGEGGSLPGNGRSALRHAGVPGDMLSIFRSKYRLILALLVCGPMASPALAQTTGFLHGRVTNEKADPLPGVVILVESAGRGVGGRGTVTDKSGAFQVAGLPP